MSNILVPQLGESVVEARIARWLKKAGDRVEVGEPVVELETEKIDLEVSAEKSGVIASIARQEGEDVKIGELLATIDDSGTAATAPATEPSPAPSSGGNGSGGTATENRATPTARRMARDHDVDLGTVQGSGAAGRVTKQDVQKAMSPSAPTSNKVAPTSTTIAPTSTTIAPTSNKIAPTSPSSTAPTSNRSHRPTRPAPHRPPARKNASA